MEVSVKKQDNSERTELYFPYYIMARMRVVYMPCSMDAFRSKQLHNPHLDMKYITGIIILQETGFKGIFCRSYLRNILEMLASLSSSTPFWGVLGFIVYWIVSVAVKLPLTPLDHHCLSPETLPTLHTSSS